VNNSLVVTKQNGILPLTDSERERLEEYEAQIESGFEYLHRIKDEGLYREYGSFENYFVQRWVAKSYRRQNQILAGFRVYEVLQDQLGTGVPIGNNEFSLRPLVTLATQSPETAAEVYGYAIELANGDTPSYSDVIMAKKIILTPEEVARKAAIDQINGMRFYNDLVLEIQNGGDPKFLLGLAVALESCETRVRRVIRYFNVRDLALIRLLNDGYVRNSETAQEIINTGYLQFEDGAIKLSEATAKDYRRLLDIHRSEHYARQRDQNRGKAVSVVIFNGDPQGTLESLRQVLDYTTLIGLQNLISQI